MVEIPSKLGISNQVALARASICLQLRLLQLFWWEIDEFFSPTGLATLPDELNTHFYFPFFLVFLEAGLIVWNLLTLGKSKLNRLIPLFKVLYLHVSFCSAFPLSRITLSADCDPQRFHGSFPVGKLIKGQIS